MKIFEFLDTTIEDVERIKKGRANINKTTTFTTVMFVFFLILGVFFYQVNYFFSAIYSMTFAIVLLFLDTALVLKREIFSLAIILKEKEEKE